MALLTPSELAWLKGEKQVSKGYERFLRHSIRKKLSEFSESELPLIMGSGLVSSIPNVSAGANALVAQPGRAATLADFSGTNAGYRHRNEGKEPWVGVPAPKDAFGPTTSTLPRFSNMGVLSPNPTQDWGDFRKYLERVNGKKTVPIRLAHAKKYSHILTTGNAQELLSLPDTTRQNVMKSLVLLAKYQGCYGRWKEIKEAYQLKWSNDDGLQAFNEIFNGKNNYTAMLAWLQDVCTKIPESYASILIFDSLTGLRPDEACQSIRLIHSDGDKYLNKERMVLEHFNYKEIFIRRTKKAYISLVTPEILEVAKNAEDCGYNALRLIVNRRDLDMNMGYCRKIFSTYLRMNGIESELIDLLQGRIPKTVFARHYFRPDFEKDIVRIKNVIEKLKDELPLTT